MDHSDQYYESSISTHTNKNLFDYVAYDDYLSRLQDHSELSFADWRDIMQNFVVTEGWHRTKMIEKFCKHIARLNERCRFNHTHMSHDNCSNRHHTVSEHRDSCIEHIGWAVPDNNCIAALVSIMKTKTVLSINSGLAYWEYLLELHDVNVIASDANNQLPNKRFMFVEKMYALEAIEKHETDVLLSIWPPLIDDRESSGYSSFETLQIRLLRTSRQLDASSHLNVSRRLDEIKNAKNAKRGINRILRIQREIDNKMTLSEKNTSEDIVHALRIFKGDTFVLVGESGNGCTGSSKLKMELETKWIMDSYISHPNWNFIHSEVMIYKRK